MAVKLAEIICALPDEYYDKGVSLEFIANGSKFDNSQGSGLITDIFKRIDSLDIKAKRFTLKEISLSSQRL